ncbi:MAG: mechanosensitive ion channel, partial [Caldilineaceae bacterium]|nr:mechanosensitive ion channel [Caldilineaceae bacterium]
VALAVQNILGDILCSVSIMLDKPFEVGDFIVVDDKLGNVEKIGIKTTRVRSLQGEEIVFPNTDLVGSRIQNFKRMKERRIVSVLGVTYETPADKVEAIPGMITEVFGALDEARLDRAHFKSFGPSSLDYEIVYYVASGDYNLYMDLQQRLNLALLRRFQSEGIEFAYPTQTIHLAQAAAS